jgi:hypothetical protein
VEVLHTLKRAVQIGSVLTGADPFALVGAFRGAPRFVRTLAEYTRRVPSGQSFRPHLADLFPVLSDYRSEAGSARGHYFHQDLWFARKIFAARPARHIDIGSRVDGFVAHLLTFMPVTVIDVRPMHSSVEGLSFLQSDATRLDNLADDSVESVSTLHAVEHFGLGRYGDPIDPDACFTAMRSLSRVLAPRGRLYFSVPIGRERVEFNAHRVFDPYTILDAFRDLRLVSFAAVDDAGDLQPQTEPSAWRDARFACGLFELTK